MKLILNAEGVVSKIIDCKADAETFDASSGAAPLANIIQPGDCMDEARRDKGNDPSQLKVILNAQGVVSKIIDCKAVVQTFAASFGAAPFANIMQAGTAWMRPFGSRARIRAS